MRLQQVTTRELTVSTALTSADFDEDGMLGLIIGEINHVNGLAAVGAGLSGSARPGAIMTMMGIWIYSYPASDEHKISSIETTASVENTSPCAH